MIRGNRETTADAQGPTASPAGSTTAPATRGQNLDGITRRAQRQEGRTVRALLLIVLLLDPGRAFAEGNTPWPWPVPVDPPQITATFMESRSGGYHTGLDIRTGGRTGMPVRTSLTGDVVRIRTSAQGYGKALYLGVGGGRTLVFAHLAAFADPVQELVTARQARSRRYEQDIQLEAGALRFEAGEVVALSGDTGTGAPHLHLEVREGSVPVNPIDFFDVPDRADPRVTALRVVPLTPRARVEGRLEAVVAAPGDTVIAVGTVGLQVIVEDGTGINGFRLMPRRIQAVFDDGRRYAVDQDRIRFRDRWQRGLEVVPDGDGTRWLSLYRRRDLTHRVRGAGGSESGRIRVGERARRVSVLVEDHAGRSSVADVVLRPDPAVEAEVPPFDVPASTGAWVAHTPAGIALGVRPDPAWATPDLVRRRGDGRTLSSRLQSFRDAEAEWWWVIPPREALISGQLVIEQGKRERVFRSIVTVDGGEFAPTSPTAVDFLDGEVRVRIPGAEDMSTDTVLWIDPVATDAPALHDGTGAAFEVVAPGAAFRRGIEVSVAVGGAADEFTLAARDRRGRWSSESGVESDPDRPGAIRTRLTDTGVYRVIRDVSPPAVGPFRVEGRVVRGRVTLSARARIDHGVARPRWPAIVLDVADHASGIDPDGVTVTLGGQRYPARPELEDDHVWIEWDVDPGPGVHDLRVEVADRLGNVATTRLTVELVD